MLPAHLPPCMTMLDTATDTDTKEMYELIPILVQIQLLEKRHEEAREREKIVIVVVVPTMWEANNLNCK